MDTKAIAVYLNHHLAGAAAGVATLDTLRAYPAVSAEAGRLYDEVQADKRELEDIIRRLGAEEGPARRVAGWVGEKVAEAKIFIDDPKGGLLREFELIEFIAIGVHGKRALWESLRAVSGEFLPLQTVDFDRLAARADDQRARLESLRLAAARRALTPAPRSD
jgi:hypothetical protein